MQTSLQQHVESEVILHMFKHGFWNKGIEQLENNDNVVFTIKQWHLIINNTESGNITGFTSEDFRNKVAKHIVKSDDGSDTTDHIAYMFMKRFIDGLDIVKLMVSHGYDVLRIWKFAINRNTYRTKIIKNELLSIMTDEQRTEALLLSI